MGKAARRTIDDVLAAARAQIRRYGPPEALAAQGLGAIIIDTRRNSDIALEGRIPGAVHLHLSVLPWRCDPAGSHRDPRVCDTGKVLIIVCNDGYSSSLAAATLVEIGFAQAGDLIGGFRAWSAAGLPVDPASA